MIAQEPREVTEGQRVVALGAHVEIGGERLRLRFDYEALEAIEDEFGSLYAFSDALDQGFHGRLLKLVRAGLAAGLRHTGMPAEVVLECLQPPIGPEILGQYHAAVTAAWVEAFPVPKESKGKGEGETSGSPGATTTTSRRSASGARTKSSGA